MIQSSSHPVMQLGPLNRREASAVVQAKPPFYSWSPWAKTAPLPLALLSGLTQTIMFSVFPTLSIRTKLQ